MKNAIVEPNLLRRRFFSYLFGVIEYVTKYCHRRLLWRVTIVINYHILLNMSNRKLSYLSSNNLLSLLRNVEAKIWFIRNVMMNVSLSLMQHSEQTNSLHKHSPESYHRFNTELKVVFVMYHYLLYFNIQCMSLSACSIVLSLVFYNWCLSFTNYANK